MHITDLCSKQLEDIFGASMFSWNPAMHEKHVLALLYRQQATTTVEKGVTICDAILENLAHNENLPFRVFSII